MKALTLLCSLALSLCAAKLTAQDLAVASQQPAGTELLTDNNPPADSPAATPAGIINSKQASAWLNGGKIHVETLPASLTVLITYTLPMNDDWASIELVDAATDKVIFTGNVYLHDGQVELPVNSPTGSYEVRLSTEHDLLIARMAD